MRCCSATLATRPSSATSIARLAAACLLLASPVAAQYVELPEVAFCMSGAVRSLPTVPVLRGLKRNVLQSASYSASLFAALSYNTESPQALDYNASLMKFLSMRAVVRRGLAHLRPELKVFATYNTSEALAHFKPCRASEVL